MGKHSCSHVCPVCGGCTSKTCSVKIKCQGH